MPEPERDAVGKILNALRGEISGIAQAELPAVIGQIEAVKAEAFARLMSEKSVVADVVELESDDRLLTVEEVAQKLGQSSRWVRDHKVELPRVKLPGRTLRFSEKRLAALIKRRSYG